MSWDKVIIVGLVALVVLWGIVRYRSRADITLKGPGGTSLQFGGSNDHNRAEISVSNVRSRKGGLVVDDATGGTVRADRVDVQTDIAIHSGDQSSPKG